MLTKQKSVYKTIKKLLLNSENQVFQAIFLNFFMLSMLMACFFPQQSNAVITYNAIEFETLNEKYLSSSNDVGYGITLGIDASCIEMCVNIFSLKNDPGSGIAFSYSDPFQGIYYNTKVPFTPSTNFGYINTVVTNNPTALTLNFTGDVLYPGDMFFLAVLSYGSQTPSAPTLNFDVNSNITFLGHYPFVMNMYDEFYRDTMQWNSTTGEFSGELKYNGMLIFQNNSQDTISEISLYRPPNNGPHNFKVGIARLTDQKINLPDPGVYLILSTLLPIALGLGILKKSTSRRKTHSSNS